MTDLYCRYNLHQSRAEIKPLTNKGIEWCAYYFPDYNNHKAVVLDDVILARESLAIAISDSLTVKTEKVDVF